MSEENPGGVWSESSESGYLAARIERAQPENHAILREYAEWLKAARGLSAGSVTVRVGSAATFLDAVSSSGSANASGVDAMSALTSQGLEDFFVGYAREHGKAASRSMQASMRPLLRFAHEKGWTSTPLWESVPRLRSYRLSSVPWATSDAALHQLVESEWTGCHSNGLAPQLHTGHWHLSLGTLLSERREGKRKKTVERVLTLAR